MNGFGGKSFFQVKSMFFDRPGVDNAMDRAKFKFLGRAGALVRKVARRSIRKGKKASLPGQPPKGHGRQLLKNFIFFGIDKQTDECVVGPVKLNQTLSGKDGQPVRGTVPSVLESSGQVWTKEVFQYGKWRRPFGNVSGLPIRFKRVTIKARPFMAPALAVSSKQLAPLMRGLFKKGS